MDIRHFYQTKTKTKTPVDPPVARAPLPPAGDLEKDTQAYLAALPSGSHWNTAREIAEALSDTLAKKRERVSLEETIQAYLAALPSGSHWKTAREIAKALSEDKHMVNQILYAALSRWACCIGEGTRGKAPLWTVWTRRKEQ